MLWSQISDLEEPNGLLKHAAIETSTGERPLFDILQDRRFWVVHVVAVPALFVAGCAADCGASEGVFFAEGGYEILTDRFN